MTRVKLRCIMGCPGLKSSYQEKGLLKSLPTPSEVMKQNGDETERL